MKIEAVYQFDGYTYSIAEYKVVDGHGNILEYGSWEICNNYIKTHNSIKTIEAIGKSRYLTTTNPNFEITNAK